MSKQKRGRYTRRDLKEDLGAVVELLVFLATLLGAVLAGRCGAAALARAGGWRADV